MQASCHEADLGQLLLESQVMLLVTDLPGTFKIRLRVKAGGVTSPFSLANDIFTSSLRWFLSTKFARMWLHIIGNTCHWTPNFLMSSI